jgi:uncharacterized protein YkwD
MLRFLNSIFRNNNNSDHSGNSDSSVVRGSTIIRTDKSGFGEKILDMHNSERAAIRVAPLTWSNDLVAGAQAWAQHLATTGQFVHDPVHTGLTCKGPCYGENITGFFNDVSEQNGGQTK